MIIEILTILMCSISVSMLLFLVITDTSIFKKKSVENNEIFSTIYKKVFKDLFDNQKF